MDKKMKLVGRKFLNFLVASLFFCTINQGCLYAEETSRIKLVWQCVKETAKNIKDFLDIPMNIMELMMITGVCSNKKIMNFFDFKGKRNIWFGPPDTSSGSSD